MALNVVDLLKVFGKKKSELIAVDHVSFSVSEGEILSILGRNGAGKNTIVKMLSGLLIPDGGDIFSNGESIKKNLKKHKSDVGFVLEGSRNVYWYMSGMENLQYYGALSGLSSSMVNQRSLDLLREFDLYEVRDKKAGDYSRGMLQKLSICIALLKEPVLLFLDEPTLGLDVVAKSRMKVKLKEIVKKYNSILIITSHELDVCQDLSDKVLILDKGRIKAHDFLENIWNYFDLKKKIIEINFSQDLNEDIFSEIDPSLFSIESKEYWGSGLRLEIAICDEQFDGVFKQIMDI